MVLNKIPVDSENLKFVILSTPKTGNTWLRWLLHYAYDTPIVDLPTEWNNAFAASLPRSFVTHQHLPPTENLVRWLVDNRAVVLTTIRHPGDTFVSLFHYVKWSDDGADPRLSKLKEDGPAPGENALSYLANPYPQEYAMSLSWSRLGALMVRYEDLLADPLAELKRITDAIAPVDEKKLKAAAFLCKPDMLTRPGLVDPRHLRSAAARRWRIELGVEHVQLLKRLQPYQDACRRFGFDWDPEGAPPANFDYDIIDPFHGHRCFDNGEPVGTTLARVYYHDVADAFTRWPDPFLTAGDSFWRWLISPIDASQAHEGHPRATLTNLMWSIYKMRPDLAAVYPDPVGADRIGFAKWFVGQAHSEFGLAWGLVSPVLDAFCDFLVADASHDEPPAGRISACTIRDASGIRTRTFACGDQLSITLNFELSRRVERPVIEYTLRNPAGIPVFATNTSMLDAPLPGLDAGTHRWRINTGLSVPPQEYHLSVGLACLDSAGSFVPIHRLSDQGQLDVTGAGARGTAWCATTITCDPVAQKT